jgi:hypothetical protein
MNPKEFGHFFLASCKDHTVGVSFHIDKTFKTSFGLVCVHIKDQWTFPFPRTKKLTRFPLLDHFNTVSMIGIL